MCIVRELKKLELLIQDHKRELHRIRRLIVILSNKGIENDFEEKKQIILNQIEQLENLHKKFIEMAKEHLQENKENTPDFNFTNWVSENYVKLHGMYVHRYASQSDKKNHKTIEELHDIYNYIHIDVPNYSNK